MRLTNLRLREHFLVKLFTLARFRAIAKQPEMGRLVAFHAGHKLLLLAYNQSRGVKNVQLYESLFFMFRPVGFGCLLATTSILA